MVVLLEGFLPCKTDDAVSKLLAVSFRVAGPRIWDLLLQGLECTKAIRLACMYDRVQGLGFRV